ncbi:hypothetical protein MRX96_032179 [Rhipicephalus microplus]
MYVRTVLMQAGTSCAGASGPASRSRAQPAACAHSRLPRNAHQAAGMRHPSSLCALPRGAAAFSSATKQVATHAGHVGIIIKPGGKSARASCGLGPPEAGTRVRP